MHRDLKESWGAITKDFMFLRGKKSNLKNIISSYFFNPGFKCVVLLRVQLYANNRKRIRLAQLISNYNLSKTGAEFCVGVQVGSPLIIRHPSGIVVGGGVVIGDYCTILQGVTLGRVNLENSAPIEYPKVGSHVVFGAYCAALGNIIIVNGTTLGAHSVLLSSALKKGTYVGIPAKLVKDLDINE